MCDQDGTSGVNTHMTNTRNTPVEVLERIMPVKVIRYGLAPNSEGPGKHRVDLELSESWNSRQMRWTALLPLIVLIRHRGD